MTRKMIKIDRELIAETVLILASTEGFVPTAIRSDVMRFREKMQNILKRVDE